MESKKLAGTSEKCEFGLEVLEVRRIWRFWRNAQNMVSSPEAKKLELELAVSRDGSRDDMIEVSVCEECGGPIADFGGYWTSVIPRLERSGCPEMYDLSCCAACDAPLIEEVGNCPECGGLVLNFQSEFACINSLIGNCNFIINAVRFSEKLLDGRSEVFAKLLGGSLYAFADIKGLNIL